MLASSTSIGDADGDADGGSTVEAAAAVGAESPTITRQMLAWSGKSLVPVRVSVRVLRPCKWDCGGKWD
jgi:hypothetical protein